MSVATKTKRIDVDTHFTPRVDRSELLDLLPRSLQSQALDMLHRELDLAVAASKIKAEMRGEELPPERGGDPERDPDARVELAKGMGFDMQVLIPGGGFSSGSLHGAGPYMVSPPHAVRMAICRIYNNAAGAAQLKYPETFLATMTVPFDDLAAAAEEVRRCAVEFGTRLVVLPFNWMGKNFDEPALFPFWEALEEFKITVICHGTTQGCRFVPGGDHLPQYPAAFAERMRRLHLGTYMGFGLEYIMATGALSLGGVFDEFQHLNFCFFEAGASWFPYALYACDRAFLIEPQCSRTRELPSDLIRKHCLTAVEPMESIIDLISNVGNENFFFGTDFPHGEYRVFHAQDRKVTTHPAGPASILEREGLTELDKSNLLGGNLSRILGL